MTLVLCAPLLWLLWIAGFSGCSAVGSSGVHRRPAGVVPPSPRNQAPAAAAHSITAFADDLYALTDLEFDTAVLLKPPRLPESSPDAWIRSLAPLVVVEQRSDHDAEALQSRISAFTVLAAEDSLAVHGEDYRRVMFAGMEGADLAWVLVFALDDRGFPIVFEVQESGDGGVGRIFAVRSLESAAAAAFGPPLPGRRFSVEADKACAPNTIVARIVEDGPEPMGPYVYYRPAGTPGVTTLLCRCSPAQVNMFSASQDYQLEIVSPEEFRRITAGIHSPSLQLDRRLRIPPGFGKEEPAAPSR